MMRLSEIDAAEFARLHPTAEMVTLEFGARSSTLVVATWNGRPVCFIGIIDYSDCGYIWMESLPETFAHPTAIVRHSRDLIRRALDRYGKIVGHCNAESSVRWMRSLGAQTYTAGLTYFEITR